MDNELLAFWLFDDGSGCAYNLFRPLGGGEKPLPGDIKQKKGHFQPNFVLCFSIFGALEFQVDAGVLKVESIKR